MDSVKNILFFRGQGNPELSNETIKELEGLLGLRCWFNHIDFDDFSDREEDDWIPRYEQIKGKTVIFFQGTHEKKFLWELMQMIWAMKHQYGAARVIVVLFFVYYRRQDHPENMKEICRLRWAMHQLAANGADDLVTISPHSGQMEKFCLEEGMRFHEANPGKALADSLDPYVHDPQAELRWYSPDGGSIGRAAELAKILGGRVIFTLKNRSLNNDAEMKDGDQEEIAKIIKHWQEKTGFTEIFYASEADIVGHTIVMLEDEISTGQTASTTSVFLKKLGAVKVIIAAVNPVLSPGWRRKLVRSGAFDHIIMGNTIPRGMAKSTGGEIYTLSMSKPIAQKIYQIIKSSKP